MSGATIATLALGIGLDTGVFTLVDGILFRARVEHDPQSFVQINPDYSGPAAPPAQGLPYASLRDYRAYRARTESLAGVAAWSPAHASIGAMGQDEAAVDMVPMLVTCNYFDVFGADIPLMGRVLRADECGAAGRSAVVVLGEDVWRARFGADPRIVGATIALNRRPFTVVGVMKSGYAGNLLTESLLLAAVAMPLSAYLAYLVPVVFKRMTPLLPFYPLRMDLGVFGYLAGITTLAGVLAGMAPALESLKPSVSASLRGQDTLAPRRDGRRATSSSPCRSL